MTVPGGGGGEWAKGGQMLPPPPERNAVGNEPYWLVGRVSIGGVYLDVHFFKRYMHIGRVIAFILSLVQSFRVCFSKHLTSGSKVIVGNGHLDSVFSTLCLIYSRRVTYEQNEWLEFANIGQLLNISATPKQTYLPYSCVIRCMRLYLHRKRMCAYVNSWQIILRTTTRMPNAVMKVVIDNNYIIIRLHNSSIVCTVTSLPP